MIEIHPMDGPFGVEIHGFDIASNPSDADMRKIVQAFYENQFLALNHQNLTHEQFRDFCRWFGRPKPHLLDHLRLPGYPEILTLSNIFENGKPIGIFEGTSFWHTDVAYEDPPNSSTIAYSILVPKQQVALEVASLFLAYDALPTAMKTRIAGMRVLHHYGNRDDMDENSPYSAERLTTEQKKKIANVYQPLVMTHPVTGRKGLYAVAGSSFGIEGMPDDEAIDLLDELKRHATKPEFVLRYRYDVGAVAAWDTLTTLHKAPLTRPSTGENDQRLLWRISVTGRHPAFAAKAAEMAAAH